MKEVSIIDYGLGNILSVQRAFEHQGARTRIISEKQEITDAEYLVLHGVGAFKEGMRQLEERDYVEAIRSYCEENRPFLGICLGMQMMLEESEEFGNTKGLGIIPGSVKRIPDHSVEGEFQKVPHVGWNRLCRANENTSWEHTVLEGIAEGERMYFVHSFTGYPAKEEHRLADAYYGGQRLAAVIRKGNCYGTQFHPEKSGESGLRLIANFLSCE
jgi:glutamine amidotransferase